MRVLIINGSHRPGNTDAAIKRVITQLQPKVDEVRELILRDIEMSMPDGCVACAEAEVCPNIHDEFSNDIEPTIRDYDLYVLATPTWSDHVTPLTKIFWDRIVSWCHQDRMYLKDKKLALIVHGMAGESSWHNVIDWIKSVSTWEECQVVGSLTFKSGGEAGDLTLADSQISQFISQLLLD